MSRRADSAGIHNLGYLEDLYTLYRRDPGGLAPAWREWFGPDDSASGSGPCRVGPSFRPRSVFDPAPDPESGSRESRFDPRDASLRDRLNELIRNYRVRGHRIAAINPFAPPPPPPPELELEYYGFSERELNLLTGCAALPYDQPLTVREIFRRLRNTYCRSIGVQFMQIDDAKVRAWLQRRMELSENRLPLARAEQLRILTRLTDAVIFEEFLRRRFVGAKTFSLEGSETLLPLLDLAIERAGEQGVRDIILGMAHRGRLNVQAHIIGKSPCAIFREFADAEPERWLGRGDVRYHLGCSGDWTTASGEKVHLSLCFNPSHLEFINPVLVGRVRARQERIRDEEGRAVCGILIHGDAAFAGEGVVQETLNFSQLPGYFIGGVLHVIVNNQIGFTTLPLEGRGTPYATDVARMLQAPIFHVNGEDPEAVAQVVRLAMDFRQVFHSDVLIDMYGYRRWGHNETDEPSFTQPLLYRAIERHRDVRGSYLDHLLQLKGVTEEEAEALASARRARLEQQLAGAGENQCAPDSDGLGIWRDYTGGPEPAEEPNTGVPPQRLAELLRKMTELPTGFQVHPKLQRAMAARREMADGKRPVDWAAAEALAFASLATEGAGIRLAGQDSARGTFSQRHLVLHDPEDGASYAPLQHLAAGQAPVHILNSPLSEAGALGFEYGYSLDAPDGLVLWEAQFGDFVNAAQVIVDQFIASAEDKWRRLSGLVLLLPHGFEGMGPEHSSARLERFLALAAEDNLQLVQPTTPAQYFHCLRRQALRRWRKPLVVFTPKSLLRHPRIISPLEDLARGSFQRTLWSDSPSPQRVLMCTGKIFYELLAHREKFQRDNIALLRLEQLYPLRDAILERALAPCPAGTPIVWVQEEPENMGAWRYLRARFGEVWFGRFPLQLVSRPESASPATGSHGAHELEQAELIQHAFDLGRAAPITPGQSDHRRKGNHVHRDKNPPGRRVHPRSSNQ